MIQQGSYIESSALCKMIICVQSSVTQTHSSLFVKAFLGVKAVPLWCKPKGAYNTLSFWGAEPTSSQCQRDLHQPSPLRLAQPVAEMHHGRWTADAAGDAGI